MFARVARWEGEDADAIRRAAEEVRPRVESGLPEGVPAKSFLLLIDPDNQRQIAISLFDSEDDLRKGDEVLNSMNPPEEGIGVDCRWRCTKSPWRSGISGATSSIVTLPMQNATDQRRG